jgi:hypothetical protein
MKAGCCKALFFPGNRLRTLFVDSFFLAIDKSNIDPEIKQISIDNFRMAKMMVPLPLHWEEWPEDSQEACPKEIYQRIGVPRFYCKALSVSGECTIYKRRPYICRDFAPKESECQTCENWCDGQCKP